METIASLLAKGSHFLNEHQIADSARSAHLLLAHILTIESSSLLLNQTKPVDPAQEQIYWSLIDRRSRHEPVDYLIGSRPFRGLTLSINQYTLIPRSETEQMVELVLDYIAKNRPVDNAQPLQIADIGTGSGAIAISLAHHLRQRNYNIHVYATDTSTDALAIAKQNATAYRLNDRITFIKADLLHTADNQDIPVCDIIVANLPYVPHERIAQLAPEVRDYEPILALDGGDDGTRQYRKLFNQLVSRNRQPIAIFCEIDETQGEIMTALATAYNPKATIAIEKDLRAMDRFLTILT